jgi:hypothetical protein
MGVLPSKVLELLKEEYQLQSGVRDEVKFLSRELESMYTALCKVAQVPPDKLDAEAKLWSRNVRESSYDMEDILDSFLVRVDGGGGPQPPAADTDRVWRRLMKKMGNLFGSPSKLKARRDIATAIVGMRKQLEEMAARHARYRVDHLVANSAAAPASVDPRLNALYKKASELVGIDGPRDALIQMLSIGEDETVCKKTKTVSIVGFGGLGKTTLAKAVYDKAVLQFDCRAFVSVGQNPEPEKILRDFLIDLVDNERKDNEKKSILANGGAQDLERYSCADLMVLNVEQLVKQIHEFLKGKRYVTPTQRCLKL